MRASGLRVDAEPLARTTPARRRRCARCDAPGTPSAYRPHDEPPTYRSNCALPVRRRGGRSGRATWASRRRCRRPRARTHATRARASPCTTARAAGRAHRTTSEPAARAPRARTRGTPPRTTPRPGRCRHGRARCSSRSPRRPRRRRRSRGTWPACPVHVVVLVALDDERGAPPPPVDPRRPDRRARRRSPWGTPPMNHPGSRPARRRSHAHIALVVVLPCVPATTSGRRPTRKLIAQRARHRRRARRPSAPPPRPPALVLPDRVPHDDQVRRGSQMPSVVPLQAPSRRARCEHRT